MHERSPKASPLDTILYEIDMLRHCSQSLPDKKVRAEKSKSDSDLSEYYLGIEGFLLHLRNLLAFFTSHKIDPNDLGINAPRQWAGRHVDPREYSSLMKRTREINTKYGITRSSCYDQISKFLQHCTTHRHEQARTWDVEGISRDIEPVLAEFEEHFVTCCATKKPDVRAYNSFSHSTATIRTSGVFLAESKK